MTNVFKCWAQFFGYFIPVESNGINRFPNIELTQLQDEGIKTNSFYLSEVMQQINSTFIDLQIEGLQRLKLEISNAGAVLINAVIDSTLFPKLFEFLRHDNHDLVFEAVSILKFMAFGANRKIGLIMIDLGNFRVLTNLLLSTSFDIVEQVIWMIGGISYFQSDLENADNLITQILLIPDHPEHGLPLIRALAWTLAGKIFIKNRDPSNLLELFMDLLQIPETLPTASDLITAYKNSPSLNSNIESNDNSRFEDIPILLDMLFSDDDDVIKMLSLRALVLILFPHRSRLPVDIENTFLSTVYEFLYHPQAILQSDTLFCIAAIILTSPDSAIAVANSDLFSIIKGRLINCEEYTLQMCFLLIFAIFLVVVPEKIELLLEFGALEAVCEVVKRIITIPEQRRFDTTVLAPFIKASAQFGHLERTLSIIKQNGVLDKLKELQNDTNVDIAWEATQLVNYFPPEAPLDEDDDIAGDH